MTAAETTSSVESLGILEDLYVWEDDVPVRQLLMGHAETHGPLIQAASLIPSYFGPGVRLSLDLDLDRDGNEPPTLMATIHTSQSPNEALANLDRFDEEWWLDAVTDVHRHLSFGVRFE